MGERPCPLPRLRFGIFVFGDAEFLGPVDHRTRLAIADTSALQQKYFPALGTLPREKPEFGIDVFLEKAVARNSCELYFGALGARFLRLRFTHGLP